MIAQSRYNGFISFDAMFSILPVLVLVLFVSQLSSMIGNHASEKIHRQQVFDKLVSIADYIVKSGAVRSDSHANYPNWINEDSISNMFVGDLRERSGLSELQVSLHEPDDELSMCIYRVVVIGDDKKIARIFVCGE